MAERLLTPSKVTAWLDCDHYLTLRHQTDAGELEPAGTGFGALSTLLADKGRLHERECLEHLRNQGRDVIEVPPRTPRETFPDWVARVTRLLHEGHEVLYQMPLSHDGVRGIADFLQRRDTGDGGFTYEPVDAKLARGEARPGHVLQLCFYAEAIEALIGTAPEQVHLWLGSGLLEHVRLAEVRPYWNRIRLQLAELLADDADRDTEPTPCAHCTFCEFAGNCEAQWRDADAIHYVAGLHPAHQAALADAGVETLTALAQLDRDVPGLRPDRLEKLRAQAQLQLQAASNDDGPPPFALIEAAPDPPWGHGLAMLPRPDDGDVFLDFEGHPFWRPDTGLLFLFGLLVRDDGDWRYEVRWSHSLDELDESARWLVRYLVERRERFPDLHVYHYNHTERSALEAWFVGRDLPDNELNELIEQGTFVDLYPVVRNAVQVGTESYSLKKVERLAEFARHHDIERGAGAVLEYESFTQRVADHERGGLDADGAPELARIAEYNEDDVRATLALREWLIEQRPADLEWRPAVLEQEEVPDPETVEVIDRLQQAPPGSAEHLLGDVLGYWRREYRTFRTQLLAKADADGDKRLDDDEVIDGLEARGLYPRYGKKGNELKMPGLRFRFPDQQLPEKRPSTVIFPTEEGPPRYATVDEFDADSGTLGLNWNEEAQQAGEVPSLAIVHDWVSARPKPQALTEFGEQVLDAGGIDGMRSAASALLRADDPLFRDGGGPDGDFHDDIEAMTQWALDLDTSCLAIQGPPGTGKTYRAAHITCQLLAEGKRVGITAMSHAAIDNLLEEIVEVAAARGESDVVRAIRKPNGEPAETLPGVTYTSSPNKCASDEFNLVAGTTWLFANQVMRAAPVDVLLIDEAGQLALADALAAATAARNVVLLGDPLQLKQVSVAVHPSDAGASALEHILGDAVTLPADRGIFLPETRRMHPDVCGFISDLIYEGRLSSHADCALQDTGSGTGLRWMRAEHRGRTTSSEEEAELIAAEIGRLVGTTWRDSTGTDAPLGVDDFMVVAPYNDQVDLLRARLDEDRTTRGVPVGTVDKFQGRQAAVVFFSMATSSSADVTRGLDFLMSRNRLNVAISRARCLAYLVCTEELLNSRARTLEHMRLIATLCAFVEYAVWLEFDRSRRPSETRTASSMS